MDLHLCEKSCQFSINHQCDSNICIKKLNLKLTSALKAYDICFLDIVYLIKHSSAIIFHFVFIQKINK